MSLYRGLSSKELESRTKYNQLDPLTNQTSSLRKYIKLNRNISLPFIREFKGRTINNNTNNITNLNENNINRSNGTVKGNSNAKTSTSILNDLRSRNKHKIFTNPSYQSSFRIQSKGSRSQLKLSTKNIIQGFVKPKKAKTKINLMFDKLFKIDNKTIAQINKLKSDKKMALRKDFNLISYQNQLMNIVAENTSSENLRQLSLDFKTLNEFVNSKFTVRKTKWQILAKKISFISPENLIIKLNSLQVKGKKPN